MKKTISILLAIVLVLGLSVSIVNAQSASSEVTVDGKVSADEWGAPVFSGNYQTNWSKAPLWDFWQFNPAIADQTYDVYVKKGAEKIYVAVKLTNAAELDTTCTSVGDLWNHAQLSFTISKYEHPTTVPKVEIGGEYREQYSYWRMGLLNGTTKASYCLSQGVNAYELQDGDYEIVYDATDKSYTYEIGVPYSATNITAEDKAVVLAMDLCDARVNGNANRYHISYAAQQAEDGLYVGESGHAGAAPIVAYFNNTYVGSTASEFSGNIAIDGKVNAEEWGEPVIVTTPTHCQLTWGNFWENVPAAVVRDQEAKVYVTNDKDNLYLAVTLDNCELDTTSYDTGMLWSNAHLGFSVAKYDEANTVPHIEYEGKQHEQYTAFWLGLVNGGKSQAVGTHGIDAQNLPESNYAVNYDEATKTYTYEVKLPISMTNINVSDTRDIALSLSIGAPSAGDTVANRYNISMGFTSALANPCPGECGMYHKNNALKVTLNDTRKKVETFVLDVAPGIATPVKLDGVISDTEWGGTPVVVTNPDHCQNTWGNFWQFNPASVNPEQVVKLYVTNDSKYLYIGATIDECDYDPTCTNVSELYKSAHFMFSVSGYDEANTAKRIEFEGDMYEQYTAFMMGLVNGKKGSYTSTQGHAAWELPEEDYAIKYDEATRTYTYEARIPFIKTNVTSNKIVVSANVGAPYSGGDAANRYNITTAAATLGGAYNWAHLNNALVITLTNNPETGDMNVFMVVAVATLAALGCGAMVIAKKRISVK